MENNLENDNYFKTTNFKNAEMIVSALTSKKDFNVDELSEDVLDSYFDEGKKNVTLPLFASSVACGFPSPAEDYVEQSLSWDKKLLKNPAATFFVWASGESM